MVKFDAREHRITVQCPGNSAEGGINMAKKQKAQTQADFIRVLFARGCAVPTILERSRKVFHRQSSRSS